MLHRNNIRINTFKVTILIYPNTVHVSPNIESPINYIMHMLSNLGICYSIKPILPKHQKTSTEARTQTPRSFLVTPTMESMRK